MIFRLKSALQVLDDQSGGEVGLRPELRPVTKGGGVKKWPKSGHVFYGRPLTV